MKRIIYAIYDPEFGDLIAVFLDEDDAIEYGDMYDVLVEKHIVEEDVPFLRS